MVNKVFLVHARPQAITYVKEIEVSHWGNIYVEEKYELVSVEAPHSIATQSLHWVALRIKLLTHPA